MRAEPRLNRQQRDSLTMIGLRGMEKAVAAPKKGLGEEVGGVATGYMVWWLKTGAWLGGAVHSTSTPTHPLTTTELYIWKTPLRDCSRL